MHCPRCLTEYRDGFYECADCRIPLAHGPAPSPSPQHSPDLVTVLEIRDSFALKLAKASLDEAGIDYIVDGEEERIPGYVGTAPGGGIWLWNWSSRIQVAREDEARARELLEPLENPEPLDESDDVEPIA